MHASGEHTHDERRLRVFSGCGRKLESLVLCLFLNGVEGLPESFLVEVEDNSVRSFRSGHAELIRDETFDGGEQRLCGFGATITLVLNFQAGCSVIT